jgi:hypothetical protein
MALFSLSLGYSSAPFSAYTGKTGGSPGSFLLSFLNETRPG